MKRKPLSPADSFDRTVETIQAWRHQKDEARKQTCAHIWRRNNRLFRYVCIECAAEAPLL